MTERIYSFTYNRDYLPPFPALEIVLSLPGRPQPTVSLSALVDTGADVTLLPLNELTHIGARFINDARVSGLFGGRESVGIYAVTIRISHQQIHAVRVAGVPIFTDAILGRDVLGQMIITLNGPAETLELHE